MAVGTVFLASVMLILCAQLSIGQKPPCPCSDPNLCTPVTHSYKKELVAFFGLHGDNWKSLNWTSLTTIIVITPMTKDFYCHAHSNKVRLIKMVGVGQTNIPKLTNPDYRAQLIKNWLQEVQNDLMDGLNLDIEESVYSEDFNQALVNLARETYSSFKAVNPHYQITWDVPYSPFMLGCVTGWCYDFYNIIQASDFAIIMSYDAQLNVLTATANSPFDLITEGILQYINEVKVGPEKLVMAIPWYGYDYTCLSFLNATGKSICVSGPKGFSNKINRGFKDMKSIERSSAISTDWDDELKAPYFTYKGENDTYHQCWYDDVKSLTFKYKFAVEQKLYGLSVFTGDCLDYNSTDAIVAHDTKTMWDAMIHYFSLL